MWAVKGGIKETLRLLAWATGKTVKGRQGRLGWKVRSWFGLGCAELDINWTHKWKGQLDTQMERAIRQWNSGRSPKWRCKFGSCEPIFKEISSNSECGGGQREEGEGRVSLKAFQHSLFLEEGEEPAKKANQLFSQWDQRITSRIWCPRSQEKNMFWGGSTMKSLKCCRETKEEQTRSDLPTFRAYILVYSLQLSFWISLTQRICKLFWPQI